MSRSRPGLQAFLLLVLFIVGVGQAFAHAALVSSEPHNGGIVEHPPKQLILNFNEPASLLTANLFRADGSQWTPRRDDVVTLRNQIVVRLPQNLGTGTHVLAWRAASSDGHPVLGTVSFSVGNLTSTAPRMNNADTAVRELLWLARATMLAALLLGAGSSGFRMVSSALPLQARQVTLAILPLGAAAVVASIPLQGLDALGQPLVDIGSKEVWLTTMASSYGATAVAALLALALASVAVKARRPHVAGWIAISCLVAIGIAASLSGHASSVEPRWLTRTVVFIHLACIAWWAGELMPLAIILRQDHAIADPPLIRFSQFIPFAIVPLVVSGFTLAAIQLGPPGPSWQTPYGYILAAKLALLVVLFSVAAGNRWVLTSRVIAGQSTATRRLRHAIVLEIAIIVAVVGLAAGWRFTPPPRSLAAAERGRDIVVSFEKEHLAAQVSIQPGRVGPNVVTVSLSNGIGARAVAVSFAKRDAAIGNIELKGTRVGGGSWQMGDVVLPVEGAWDIEVQLRISDFELARAKGTVQIGR